MRTKLLCAAAIAAGAITAMAQSNVYSLNVVGYYNVTVGANAYGLVANQLNNGTNGLDQVMPAAPYGALVLKYNPAISDYSQDISDGTTWLNAITGDPSTTSVKPGEGFFFNNPNATPLTLTFVGEVPQGPVNVDLVANGYTLASVGTPQSLVLDSSSSFPAVYSMLYLAYNPAVSDYDQSIFDGTAWLNAITGDPVTVQPAVGQGFFINNPDATAKTWARNFTVQ